MGGVSLSLGHFQRREAKRSPCHEEGSALSPSRCSSSANIEVAPSNRQLYEVFEADSHSRGVSDHAGSQFRCESIGRGNAGGGDKPAGRSRLNNPVRAEHLRVGELFQIRGNPGELARSIYQANENATARFAARGAMQPCMPATLPPGSMRPT